MRHIRLVLVVVVSLTLISPAAAQDISPETALGRLCAATALSAEWFAPQFLAAAPLPVVQQLFSTFREDFGGCLRVDRVGEQFRLIYERGVVTVARYALDAQSRFTILIVQPRMVFRALADTAPGFSTLPGTVALLVTRNGRPEVAVNTDRSMAVGSAFKLSVLATLREQIQAGRRRLDETVTTRSEWNSLPSGVVQTYADGTPVTVGKLAELMISISDNTAADMIIRLVGREAVEAVAPARNRPFLLTREAFVLKDPRNADLLARWRGGDEAVRRDVLRETATRPLLDPRSLTLLIVQGPLAQDVEWFYTVEELCSVMQLVAGDPVMAINPGLANPADWRSVSFKGGSEPGVLNLTSQIARRDGTVFCVAATWNDTSLLTDLRLFSRYWGLLELLKSLP